MKVHFGLSVLTLFWFQCSRRKKRRKNFTIWSENWKLLQTHTHTHTHVCVRLFDTRSDFIVFGLLSVVFGCYTLCFVDFSMSLSYFCSLSLSCPLLICIFVADLAYISKRESALMRLFLYESVLEFGLHSSIIVTLCYILGIPNILLSRIQFLNFFKS